MDAENSLLILLLIYLVFFVIAALVLGRVSDRIGRRKVFVYIAAYLQAIAALILAFVPDLHVAYFAAGLLGLGYGCYMAVDQALATQVLPDAHSRGKDLGIMNIATAVPQAVGGVARRAHRARLREPRDGRRRVDRRDHEHGRVGRLRRAVRRLRRACPPGRHRDDSDQEREVGPSQ